MQSKIEVTDVMAPVITRKRREDKLILYGMKCSNNINHSQKYHSQMYTI